MIKIEKVSYKAFKRLNIHDRIAAISDPQMGGLLMSTLTPYQIADLFPRYYLARMPDVSGFLKAVPSSISVAKQQALEEQLNNTVSGEAAGRNVAAGGWRRKYQENINQQTARVLKPGQVPEPQLSPEQTAVIQRLQNGENIAANDPSLKFLASITPQQLKMSGLERYTNEKGEEFFKYIQPQVTEEQAKQSLAAGTVPSGGFKDKAPSVMRRLQSELNLTREEAAAVMGNLGHESMGLKANIQEGAPNRYGTRGLGWAQWTNTPGNNRRDRFEEWSKTHGGPGTDEANLSFLIHELKTTHAGAIRRLKETDGGYNKMVAFEQSFEGAGVKAYESRYRYMQQSLGLPEASSAGKATAEAYTKEAIIAEQQRLIRQQQTAQIKGLAAAVSPGELGLPQPGTPGAAALTGNDSIQTVANKIYAMGKSQGAPIGRGECVDLARQYVGSHESVTTWRRGESVMSGNLKPGTPIATFMNRDGSPSERYDGGKTGAPGNHTTHAAVFTGYQRDKNGNIIGINVVEQWQGQAPKKSTYPIDSNRFGTRNGGNYYVVNNDQGAPLGGDVGRIQVESAVKNDTTSSQVKQAEVSTDRIRQSVSAPPDNGTKPGEKVPAPRGQFGPGSEGQETGPQPISPTIMAPPDIGTKPGEKVPAPKGSHTLEQTSSTVPQQQATKVEAPPAAPVVDQASAAPVQQTATVKQTKAEAPSPAKKFKIDMPKFIARVKEMDWRANMATDSMIVDGFNDDPAVRSAGVKIDKDGVMHFKDYNNPDVQKIVGDMNAKSFMSEIKEAPKVEPKKTEPVAPKPEAKKAETPAPVTPKPGEPAKKPETTAPAQGTNTASVTPPAPAEAPKVKAMADGGQVQTNTDEITAYPIGGLKGDNSVVVNAQQQPIFTMNTNKESAVFNPQQQRVDVIPNQKNTFMPISAPPDRKTEELKNSMTSVVQEMQQQFSNLEPTSQTNVPNPRSKDTQYVSDRPQSMITDMLDMAGITFKNPTAARALSSRPNFQETGGPQSHYNYGDSAYT